MTDCPSSYTIDTGDFAEPETCCLAIEHNADAEPWHESAWETEGVEVSVRWRWDQDTLWCRWPTYDINPMGMAVVRLWADVMGERILAPSVLESHLPDKVVPATGTVAQWLKWSELRPSVDETAYAGGADAEQ